MGSLLQEGPPFPCVHLWCYAMITQKSNEEIVGLISKKNTQNWFHSMPGLQILSVLLNALSRTKSETDIDDVWMHGRASIRASGQWQTMVYRYKDYNE